MIQKLAHLNTKHEWILGFDWYLVVCVRSCRLRPEAFGSFTNVDTPAVIYQQPRPGPKLPNRESYLTIGWKQVRDYLLITVTSHTNLDLDRLEAVQGIAPHLHLPLRVLPPCRCLWKSL
jgi:hypothetical protein